MCVSWGEDTNSQMWKEFEPKRNGLPKLPLVGRERFQGRLASGVSGGFSKLKARRLEPVGSSRPRKDFY